MSLGVWGLFRSLSLGGVSSFLVAALLGGVSFDLLVALSGCAKRARPSAAATATLSGFGLSSSTGGWRLVGAGRDGRLPLVGKTMKKMSSCLHIPENVYICVQVLVEVFVVVYWQSDITAV